MRIRIAPILALALALSAFTGNSPGQTPPKRRALLVGVSTYRKSGLADKPLPFAAADMEFLAAELRKGGWEVTLLTSKGAADHASRNQIVRTLDQVLDGVNANDLVLVAMSGHGQQFKAWVETDDNQREQQEEAFFCPSDGVPGEADTLIGMTGLLRTLSRKGGKNLVMVDACRDDPRRGGKGVDGNTARRVPANTAILFSCAARQQSFETNQMYGQNSPKGHGVFFHRVWKGLQGEADNGKGEVTWHSLVGYVTEHVNDDAVRWFPERIQQNSDGERVVQTPHLVGSLVGRSPVLVNSVETLIAKAQRELAGAWETTHIVMAGQVQSPAEYWKYNYVFDRNQLIVNHQPDLKITFTLDPARRPSHIDITANGKLQQGIYRIEGDRLLLCISDGGERPTTFEAPAGSRNGLFVLKRKKA